jgi:nucleotide-binding universal stress UspA family protein
VKEAVVRAAEDNRVGEGQRIVVGVDGSDYSLNALRWAAEQARVTQRPLCAVMSWEWPRLYGEPVVWPEDISFEDDARNVLRASVEKVLGSEGADEVDLRVVEGHAPLVLRDESAHAGLLVVGSRGHGEFAGMLLGSVSEWLATHAQCPIVIVRGEA